MIESTTNADNVTVIVSDSLEIEVVGTALRDYYAVTGTTINQEYLEGLQLGTKGGRSKASDRIIGCCTEGPIKLLGVCLDLVQTSRWTRTDGDDNFTQVWVENNLAS